MPLKRLKPDSWKIGANTFTKEPFIIFDDKHLIVGLIGDKYFYVKPSEFHLFDSISSLKTWLKEVRSSNYLKSEELLAAMRLFLMNF